MSDHTKTAAADTQNPVSMESLISAALRDLVKAQETLIAQQTDMLLNTCFKKNGDAYEAITVKFTESRDVVEPGIPATAGQPATESTLTPYTTQFNVPLISLVPLNSLGLGTVTLDFDLGITSVIPIKDSKNANEIRILVSVEDAAIPVTVQQEVVSNRLKVNVQVNQLPLPKGVATIIEAFAQSISPISFQTNNPPPVQASAPEH